MRGRKPKPTALRRAEGNPGKRGYNPAEPEPPGGCPDCPGHLSEVAQEEWHRLARGLHDMGVLTVVYRAALAAYCQAYGRWAEAEEMLKATPVMLKTPSGYVQQNPWLGVANKQLELMGRYLAELGMTPASRSRVAALAAPPHEPITRIELVAIGRDENGNWCEYPDGDLTRSSGLGPGRSDVPPESRRIELDTRL